MKAHALFGLLKEYRDKSLLFEYTTGLLVGANYHITKVKHTSIDSVDCGAKTNSWKETIIRLWESPNEVGKSDFMKVNKALEIFERVGNMKPYVLDAEVKFEYSNLTFHTAQLFVNDFETQNDNLIIKLTVEKTDCKAKTICCAPEEVEITKQTEPCCSPVENCC